MKVIWTPEAEQDRSDVYDYIAVDNPRAAGCMNERFDSAASRLVDFPYLGKQGQLPGTRELFPHKNYRLVYQVDAAADTIWILSLMHGARQYPVE